MGKGNRVLLRGTDEWCTALWTRALNACIRMLFRRAVVTMAPIAGDRRRRELRHPEEIVLTTCCSQHQQGRAGLCHRVAISERPLFSRSHWIWYLTIFFYRCPECAYLSPCPSAFRHVSHSRLPSTCLVSKVSLTHVFLPYTPAIRGARHTRRTSEP